MPTSSHSSFRTILVPTDFSDGSSAALDRALALPLAPGARLEILHVLPDRIASRVRAKVEAAAGEALAKAVARARSVATPRRPPDVTSRIVRGDAYVQIIRHARLIDAELVVVGRHGRRPVRDLFVGTTATRIVRMGDTPVLIVQGDATKPYRRILVASDLGTASRRLLGLARRLVGSSAAVNVVHAFHVPFEGFLATSRSARTEVQREFRDQALARLADLVSPHEDRAHWQKTVRAGDPRAVVLNEAVRYRADVIVLGTHGRSGLSHALIGSVAESVIADAPCDVFVARPVRFSFTLP